MGIIKSVGQTRGRGFDDSTNLVWLLSVPACADVLIVLQDIVGLSYTVSKVRKDYSRARMKRNAHDIKLLVELFRG